MHRVVENFGTGLSVEVVRFNDPYLGVEPYSLALKLRFSGNRPTETVYTVCHSMSISCYFCEYMIGYKNQSRVKNMETEYHIYDSDTVDAINSGNYSDARVRIADTLLDILHKYICSHLPHDYSIKQDGWRHALMLFHELNPPMFSIFIDWVIGVIVNEHLAVSLITERRDEACKIFTDTCRSSKGDYPAVISIPEVACAKKDNNEVIYNPRTVYIDRDHGPYAVLYTSPKLTSNTGRREE